MIDTATIERYMRDANPVPHADDLDPDEFARFVAATQMKRAAIMQAPTQRKSTESHPTPPTPPQSRRAWAFVAAFALILASIGIAALVLRSDEAPVTDEPAPETTIAETPDETTSLDPLTWTRVPLDRAAFFVPGGDTGDLSDIVAGGPGLVAVGATRGPDPTKDPVLWRSSADIQTIWTSADGHTWSRVPYNEATFGGDSAINSVTAGGPGLVAVGGVDVWLSPDGYEWTRLPRDPTVVDPITDDLRGVIAGGPGLVAYGESAGSGAVWTSADGYTWTRVPQDGAVFGRSAIHSMIASGPGLVAVGVDEMGFPSTVFPVVWTSPDGYTWTRVPHDPSVFPGGSVMFDAAAGSVGLVAVGGDEGNAAVWTSPDGFTWTQVPYDEATFAGLHDDMTSVAAFGDGFVAVGSWSGPNVWTSTDGITWSRVPADEAVFGECSMHKVITRGSSVIVLGSDSEGPAMWIADSGDPDGPAAASTTDH